MKILAVAHESEFNGGANRSFYTVLKILKEEYNADIDVVVPKKSGELVDALNEIGIQTSHHAYKWDFSVYRNEWKDNIKQLYVYGINRYNSTLAKATAHQYLKKKYDIVYVNTRMSSYGAYLARELQLPMVCHARELGNPQVIWGTWTWDTLGKLSRKVISISTAMSLELKKKISSEKFVTVLNGIDCPIAKVPVYNWNKEKINLILTGRVVEAKGHFDALEALVELRNRGIYNLVLHIVGSVSESANGIKYKHRLDQYIEENNLCQSVVFHGEIKDMFSLRGEMAAELMCSLFEPFGRVTVEAMRCGLLVIGSNTGGTLDIIDDGKTGLLYEQGSGKSLADKIEWAIRNPKQCEEIQKAGFEKSKNNFTKEKNAEEIYKVLQECIKTEEK